MFARCSARVRQEYSAACRQGRQWVAPARSTWTPAGLTGDFRQAVLGIVSRPRRFAGKRTTAPLQLAKPRLNGFQLLFQADAEGPEAVHFIFGSPAP